MPNIGDLFVSGVQPIATTALVNSFQVFVGTGELYDFSILNFDQTTAYLILLFDATTLPTNGPVIPVDQYTIPVATATTPGELGLAYTPYAIRFKNGLIIAASTSLTTPYTLTLATNAKLAISAKAQQG